MNFFLFLNGQIIENFYESMRRDCITLDECGVFFLGHSKKCLVLIGGKVHEDGQGGEMFTLALGHFLVTFGIGCGFLLSACALLQGTKY